MLVKWLQNMQNVKHGHQPLAPSEEELTERIWRETRMTLGPDKSWLLSFAVGLLSDHLCSQSQGLLPDQQWISRYQNTSFLSFFPILVHAFFKLSRDLSQSDKLSLHVDAVAPLMYLARALATVSAEMSISAHKVCGSDWVRICFDTFQFFPSLHQHGKIINL